MLTAARRAGVAFSLASAAHGTRLVCLLVNKAAPSRALFGCRPADELGAVPRVGGVVRVFSAHVRCQQALLSRPSARHGDGGARSEPRRPTHRHIKIQDQPRQTA